MEKGNRKSRERKGRTTSHLHLGGEVKVLWGRRAFSHETARFGFGEWALRDEEKNGSRTKKTKRPEIAVRLQDKRRF